MALSGWFALSLQLALGVRAGLAHGVPWPDTVLNYFSYFTIMTNLLLALGLSVPLLAPASRWGRFFQQPEIRSASLVYITIVAVVYALLLQQLWHPTGLRLFADMLLHRAIPAGYLFYWLWFVPSGRLRWWGALQWLMFPGVYLLYTLLRGALIDTYPYPFLNVLRLGYSGVLFNALLLACAFLVMSALIIAYDRHLKTLQRRPLRRDY
ncbi:Pr6Pr family membrane protein [Crenobacter sp. SG2305]|uniref:Pr6Pr family membrane protein n=1 Tax=Crenobacter oryzisoli TaxID=3056844 RepID=UPI0025AAEAE8|nr:Pr6Pr family membrane protein [Crenobacter sp. SG2305]MDN0082976.1 Pr6Pr family membrane protein [Crenobacter sp. SG2305]